MRYHFAALLWCISFTRLQAQAQTCGLDASLSARSAIPACNTPANRQCWGEYSINTDYSTITPYTGICREFYIEVTNQVIAPDGVPFYGMVFNGQFPGPLIEANWGDTLRIVVTNHLTNFNGTSIHWHGVRQLNSNWQDGVPGITSCPITPGTTSVYEFRATQYGSSWYHSHFALQYPTGLAGTLKINGPSSMNYDVDKGPLILSDWYHENAFGVFYKEVAGGAQAPSSYLLQGKGIYCSAPGSCTGSYHEMDFVAGTTYKLSIVNGGTSSQFTFWIDGHTFSVIAADFVPIIPYDTDTLNVATGQRYDIIVKANASYANGKNFWIHARPCDNSTMSSTIGIIRYDPYSTAKPYTPPGNRADYGCLDLPALDLVPVVNVQVGNFVNGMSPEEWLNVSMVYYPDPDVKSPLQQWVIVNQPMYVNWSEPSLALITDSKPFPPALDPVYLDFPSGDWVYFVIESQYTPIRPNMLVFNVTHPIHLHGHDFYILAQQSAPFDSKTFRPNLNNPIRRDTAILPLGGHMVIAFQMDNPGAWLMHCHIAWHASNGMAIQFVESLPKLKTLLSASGKVPEMTKQCQTWAEYYNIMNIPNNATQGDETGI